MGISKFKNSIFLKVLISMILFIILGFCFILPVSAKSDTLVFNLWSKYANRISFINNSGQNVRQLVYDNTVTSGNGFTSITNNQPLNDDFNYPYFTSLALFVPESHFTPQFLIQPEYVGKSYTMHLSLICASDQRDSSIINNIDVSRVFGLLYTSSPADTFIRGSSTNTSVTYINEYTFKIDADLVFNIVSSAFIYGYYFEALGIFDYNVNGEILNNYSFNVEYILSDLVFSNDLTKDEIQNIVDGSTDEIIANDNKNAEDTQAAIKDGADQISNTIRQENENEKAEASSSDKLADDLTEALGDPSAPLADSIQTLANSFAYNGTDCVFTWPEFKLPNIKVAGTDIGGLTVWSSQELNVTETIENFLPEILLTVVRGLFTISLAIFCVVEVMDIILGVLTAFSVKVKV